MSKQDWEEAAKKAGGWDKLAEELIHWCDICEVFTTKTHAHRLYD